MMLVLALIAAEPATADAPSTENPNEMICRSVTPGRLAARPRAPLPDAARNGRRTA